MFEFCQTGGEPPSSLKMQLLWNKFQFSSEIGPYLSAYSYDWLDFGIEWQKKDRGTLCTMLKFLHLRGELRITKIKIFNMTTQFTIMNLRAEIWWFYTFGWLKRHSYMHSQNFDVHASFYFIRFRPKNKGDIAKWVNAAKNKKFIYSLWCSQAVTHLSTNHAQRCLIWWSDENRCFQRGMAVDDRWSLLTIIY